MSKVEILRELPKLTADDRRQIIERLCELEEDELLHGGEPIGEQRAPLDKEWEEYQKNPEKGSSWREVQARIRGGSPR